MRPPRRCRRRVGDGGGHAPPPQLLILSGVVEDRAAEHVPGAELPRAHGVDCRLRRRGRRHDVEHGGVPVGGGPPVAVLGRRRRHAVRAGGEVADGALQPDEPLHSLPPQRRRHPGLPEHQRVAGDRAPAVVREGQGQGRRTVRQPHRRSQPHRRRNHREQRDDRRAGRDVVVQVPREQAQVHPRLPGGDHVERHHLHLERDAAQLAGVEHPPGVQQQHRGAGRDDPGADAVPQHGRHKPGLVLPRPHRGLLRRLRRRLRRHQERLGRVRHRLRHAQRAHRDPPADVRVADERRHRARQRDVGRDPRRARRGHHGGQLRVRRADQDRRREGKLRAGRVRAGDAAGRDEVRVLDDGQLQVAPGRRVRPQRHPRGGEHQLPGRGGDGGVQERRQARGHRRRAVQGHLPRQRHGGVRQVEEVPVDVRRRRGRVVGGRHAGAVRAAAGEARRRVPVPDGHAAHRPGHRAAVRLRRPRSPQSLLINKVAEAETTGLEHHHQTETGASGGNNNYTSRLETIRNEDGRVGLSAVWM